MSDFKTHSIAAASVAVPAFFLPLALGAEMADAVFFAMIVFLAANFPDLDTESVPSRWAARGVFLSGCYLVYCEKPEYALVIAGLFVLTKVGVHRGWTHKYTTPILIAAAGVYLFPELALLFIGFSIGMIVHLAVDRISPLEKVGWI